MQEVGGSIPPGSTSLRLLRKLRLGKPAENYRSEASEGCRGGARRAKPGSIRTTCGTIDAKYGTRTIAAAENSRVPPGRSARRCHMRYVVVGAAMPAYLTLE